MGIGCGGKEELARAGEWIRGQVTQPAECLAQWVAIALAVVGQQEGSQPQGAAVWLEDLFR